MFVLQAEVYKISDLHLVFSVCLVLIAGGISASLKLGLLKSLAWGAVRTFTQLLVMGYALVWIFSIDSPILIVAIILAMCFFGARVAVKSARSVSGLNIGLAFISLTASTFIVAFIVTAVVISADKWYTARIVIPVAGMILGNSMNGISLGIDRLFSDFRNKSDEIETMLSLGATPWEAIRDKVKDALRTGMTPSINSMMSVGIVFLPGMMTGQILGGVDPLTAVRYQIIVMMMITAAAAIGCLMLVLLSYKKCFDADGGIRKEYLSSSKKMEKR